MSHDIMHEVSISVIRADKTGRGCAVSIEVKRDSQERRDVRVSGSKPKNGLAKKTLINYK